MDTEKINQLQFLHKVQLTSTAKSIIGICDSNEILESDILTMSAFMYLMSGKNLREKVELVNDFSNMNKSQRREIASAKDIDGKLMRILSESYYRRMNAKRMSVVYKIPYENAAKLTKASYGSFIQFYINDFFKDFDDERFIKKFVTLVKETDYAGAVRLYFLAICLGRNSLIDKFSRIQRDKCKKNFVYALNREVIMASTILVKYGKGKEVELLAEQTLEMSNEAVDEANQHVAELQSRFREYDKDISDLERQLAEAHHTISELRLQLSKINNQLILEDMNVLVIGDEGHIEGYREIIERHGGEYEFTSGVKTKGASAMRKAVRADIVFLVTAWCHHEVTDAIKDFSNIVWVNSAGLDSLERVVLKLRNGG